MVCSNAPRCIIRIYMGAPSSPGLTGTDASRIRVLGSHSRLHVATQEAEANSVDVEGEAVDVAVGEAKVHLNSTKPSMPSRTPILLRPTQHEIFNPHLHRSSRPRDRLRPSSHRRRLKGGRHDDWRIYQFYRISA